MDYSKFDLSKLKFLDERAIKFAGLITSLLGLNNDSFVILTSDKHTTIAMIGEAIGFTDPNHKKLLDYYTKEDNIRNKWSSFLSPLFIVFCFFFVFIIMYYIGEVLNITINTGALLILSLIILVLTFSMGMKIFLLVFEKHFIETICINAIFQIILFLHKDDVLSRPDRKKLLLTMTKYLARRVELFGITYRNKSLGNSEWIKNHFSELTRYVNERERWIVAPTQNTLQNLRDDFYKLATLLIVGNIGDFAWVDTQERMFLERNMSPMTNIRQGIVRSIGYIIPIILIIIYLWKPDFIPFVKVDREIATTILLAWVLLSIDIGFRLGIVTSLIKFAMDIRELSKI